MRAGVDMGNTLLTEETEKSQKELLIEPLFYNYRRAAIKLGTSTGTLDRLRKRHKIFNPIKTEYCSGAKYHKEHLEIIAGVMLGKLEPDLAYEIWEAKKTILCLEKFQEVEKFRENARKRRR